MLCKYCGKQAENNSKFCPYCGKELSAIGEGDSMGTLKESAGTATATSKIVRLILSFVIGMVLSFITFLAIENIPVIDLVLVVVLWVGIGLLAYNIILKLSNSKGISGLSGIIIGAIGMWVATNILGYWIEAVELAETGLGVFLLLLPLSLIWTFVVYIVAGAADHKNSENQ